MLILVREIHLHHTGSDHSCPFQHSMREGRRPGARGERRFEQPFGHFPACRCMLSVLHLRVLPQYPGSCACFCAAVPCGAFSRFLMSGLYEAQCLFRLSLLHLAASPVRPLFFLLGFRRTLRFGSAHTGCSFRFSIHVQTAAGGARPIAPESPAAISALSVPCPPPC